MRQGSSSMMVNGHQKNMKRSSTKQLKLVTTSNGIEKLVKKPKWQYKEFNRSMEEWKAQVESRGFKDHPAIPYGPPPKETSSMRALPDVHDALRQNDPSRAPTSQPILKKAPPTTGRSRPAAFYSGDEPPRIGSAPVQPPPPPRPVSTWDVQPQGIFHPPTATHHDSRPSTSSTDRGTSKADPRSDESGDTQASTTSTSSTGSAQQASTTQGIST